MNRIVQAAFLRCLLACGDQPMPDAGLKSYARQSSPGERYTDADLTTQTRLAEERGWLTGTADEFSGVLWTLTAKGKLRAQQNG